jgi:carbon storage regulator
MLILTRRPGEEIVIDGEIRVAVVSVRGHRVRLGIIAPLSVVVDREEIHQRYEHSSDKVPVRRSVGSAGRTTACSPSHSAVSSMRPPGGV